VTCGLFTPCGVAGPKLVRRSEPLEGCAASPEAGSCLPRHLPMPCQRLSVKDAEGAAQRSKILDGEGHGHNLSRAARHPHQP